MYRPNPVLFGQRCALSVANRHHWRLRVVAIDIKQLFDIETAVQRRYQWCGHQASERETPIIQVAVDDVEAPSTVEHFTKHRQMQTASPGSESGGPQGGRMSGLNVGRDRRIARGEERHFMTSSDQLFNQVGNDAFSTAVELRRNAFV